MKSNLNRTLFILGLSSAFSVFFSLSVQAQTRTSTLECSGPVMNGSSINGNAQLSITKKTVYALPSGYIEVSAQLKVTGKFETDAGTLEGKIDSVKVDEKQIRESKGTSYTVTSKDSVLDVKSIASLTRDKEFPGSLINLSLDTGRIFLALKGILINNEGVVKINQSSQAMEANLYVKQERGTHFLGTLKALCATVMKE